jgi:hypothetical protein
MAMVGATTFVGAIFLVGGGFEGRVGSIAALERTASERSPYTDRCLSETNRVPDVESCIGGTSGRASAYDVLVWGDSHADHFFWGLAKEGAWHGLVHRQVAKASCPPLIGVRIVFSPPNDRLSTDCVEFNERVFAEIRSATDLRLVVLAGAWSFLTETTELGDSGRRFVAVGNEPLSREGSQAAFRKSFRETVEAIRSLGIGVLILGQVPEFRRSPIQCLVRAKLIGAVAARCEIEASIIAERISVSVDESRGLENGADVRVFYPTRIMCGERCRATLDGQPLYRNHDHLSMIGSELLAKHISIEVMRTLNSVASNE